MVERGGNDNDQSRNGDNRQTENYNGWKNYETWCVNLWLGNSEEQLWRFQKLARDGLPEHDLAEAIRAYFEARNPLEDESSVFTDLVAHALQRVAWSEIAQSLFSDP